MRYIIHKLNLCMWILFVPLIILIGCQAKETRSVVPASGSSCAGLADSTGSYASDASQPSFSIHAYPDTGSAPLHVQFSASGLEDSGASFSWRFGDGCTGEGHTVEHFYEVPGVYQAVAETSYQWQVLRDSVYLCVIPAEFAGLPDAIEEYRMAHFPETRVAFWAESPDFGVQQALADEVWPAASTIKVFILIAAYLEFGDVWDQVPDDLGSLLDGDIESPECLRMYDSDSRSVIRSHLSGMSYSDLALSMMGVNQNQIGNSAYNAAANILIHELGGPAACTDRIRSICAEFQSVRVGRYMLVERTPANDNICSMRSLAAACRMIASSSTPGITEEGHGEIRDCFQRSDFMRCSVFEKHGHLSTAPSLSAWIGWIEKDSMPFIYGVNVVYEEGTSLEDRGADHYRDVILRASP